MLHNQIKKNHIFGKPLYPVNNMVHVVFRSDNSFRFAYLSEP